MYYHGLIGFGSQFIRSAISDDGIRFRPLPQVLGRPYLRAFSVRGRRLGLAMLGRFYEFLEEPAETRPGPLLFNRNMRHRAVLVRDCLINVFWTQVGDTPESICVTTIEPGELEQEWRKVDAYELMRPEFDWEGSNTVLEPSARGPADPFANQLRDPAVWQVESDTYLWYAGGRESGIGLAHLEWIEDS